MNQHRKKPLHCARSVVGIAALLLFGAVTGCGPTQMSEEEHLERAAHYQAEGNPEAEAIELRSALRQNPENIDAHRRLGVIYLSLGRTEDAIRALERAQERAGGDMDDEIRLDLGRAYWQARRAEDTLQTLNTSFSAAEHQLDAALLRGHALASENRIMEAEAAYRQALRNDPERLSAMVGLARMRATSGDKSEARKLVESALEHDESYGPAWRLLGELEQSTNPNAAEAAFTRSIEDQQTADAGRFHRGLLRLQRGDLEGAREDAQALEGHDRQLPHAAYLRGVTHFFADDFAAAADEFEDVLRRMPDHHSSVLFAGLAHFGRGSSAQAESRLEQVLRQHPGFPPAVRVLAALREGRGDTANAERLLQELIDTNPGDLASIHQLARLELAEGRLDDGLPRLVAWAQSQPQSVRGRLTLARAHLADGEADLAIEQLQTAQEMAPDALEPRVTLIVHYLENSLYQEALEEAEDLVERHPDEAVAHNLAGTALLGLQRPDSARDAFTTALQYAPGDFLATRNLAMLAQVQGNTDAAREHLQSALTVRTDDLDLLLELARFEAEMGHDQRSEALLNRAKDAHPEALRPRLVLARHRMDGGKPREAITLLEPLREVHGSNPAWLELTARARLMAGQNASAARLFTSLLEQRPDDAQTRWLLGSALLADSRYNEATNHFQAVIESHAETAAVHNSLAYARHQLGDERAEAHARDALRLEPNNPHFQGTLGMILLDNGELEEAAEYLRLAQQARPDEVSVRYRYAEALVRLGRDDQARHHLNFIVDDDRETPSSIHADARMLLEELDR
ncbi:XrtA/PEP-CTERM system TPR-repeat protein PrsT [Halorhodospira halophila]|uniref:XrtA/PEP-CTERM system TPR-repeat protein PrsT n=1 Tax=Halorhodospira halophila TaxID=1053 RepID=UPI001914D0A5|nr:XrtA/PEP-CTERM system TPR-repeat protein PrsT [Halorhodospira halophila]MBK5944032.1 hypothetical protein [Halorhodospira halophila]